MTVQQYFDSAQRKPHYPKEEFARRGDVQPWIARIDHRAVYRFGARSLKKLHNVGCSESV